MSASIEIVVSRLLQRRKIDEESGCWIYLGYADPAGYARVGYQGKSKRVHQVSFWHFKGEVPEGYEIDHLCRNKRCFNPEHLEAVTKRTNMLRGIVWEVSGKYNQAKTHCVRGHPYAGDNLVERIQMGVLGPRVSRHCRKCINMYARNARKRAKRRAGIGATKQRRSSLVPGKQARRK